MIKPADPRDLAIAMMSRSICAVQVGAALTDAWSAHAWAWNSVGSGYGEHAEQAVIRRANQSRLVGSTMWIAARRHKSGNTVTAKPCEACHGWVRKVSRVMYRDGQGDWVEWTSEYDV